MAARGIAQRIERGWTAAPAAPALWFDGAQYTWRELEASARALHVAAQRCGIVGGARVALLLRNQPGIAAAALGVLVSGRTLVAVNALQPGPALAAELRALDADAVVGLRADLAETHVAAELARARGACLEVSTDVLGPVFTHRIGSGTEHRVAPAQTVLEMLTSGTTGAPKRIPVSGHALEAALVAGMRDASDRDGEPTAKSSPSLVAGPLVHVSGLFALLHSVCEARPLILLERFAVDPWVKAVREHRLRFASLPPTAMRMVLEAGVPRADLASLIAVRAGTAPLPPDVQRAFEERYGMPVLVQYGATEWMGGVAGWTIEDHRRFGRDKLGSVGRALRGVELRVVAPDSRRALTPGEEGILEVRAPGRSEAAAGWVTTTDLASIDADGFLFIHGRTDEVIIRGGFKISPATVVAVLRTHPAVADAAVVGVPDARLGAVPVAVIERRGAGAAPTADELEELCRAALPSYQVPVRYVVVDALPRTPSLKVSRPAVLELIAATPG